MSLKVIVLACVAACALADRRPSYHAPDPYAPPPPPPPRYSPPASYGKAPEYPTVALFIVASVVVASVADQIPIYHEPQYGPPAPSYHVPVEEYPDVPPQYKYNYGVSDGYSGANFGHSESRDGYKTEGSYSVDLPDGRKQIVTYVDNGDGLEAQSPSTLLSQFTSPSPPTPPHPRHLPPILPKCRQDSYPHPSTAAPAFTGVFSNPPTATCPSYPPPDDPRPPQPASHPSLSAPPPIPHPLHSSYLSLPSLPRTRRSPPPHSPSPPLLSPIQPFHDPKHIVCSLLFSADTPFVSPRFPSCTPLAPPLPPPLLHA
ncbi:hypothetical protein O3P69_018225 [Scylla paramamosain]|uniref:Cuticle protein n=1 Tax=Scylla paramamosain TaxID=85552 RepID=A0AAW0TLJ5_SCYPA